MKQLKIISKKTEPLTSAWRNGGFSTSYDGYMAGANAVL